MIETPLAVNSQIAKPLMDSQRVRDLFLLLSTLSVAACTDRPSDSAKPSARSVCEAYAEGILACYGDDYEVYADQYTEECIDYIEEAQAEDPACGDAVLDYFACLSEVDCADLEAGRDLCPEAGAELERKCPSESDAVESDGD